MDIYSTFAPFVLEKNGKNLTGQKFDRLTVVSIHSRSSHAAPKTRWLCRCECGTWLVVTYGDLRSKHTRSCGCLAREMTRALVTTHGLSKTKEYKWLYGMKNRCENPRDVAYKHYGGRGIECRFTTVEELKDALGDRPSPHHSIDRIDNDGHYEKGNVRWATSSTQCNNTRNTLHLTHNGVTQPLQVWYKQLLPQVSVGAWFHRKRQGWCDECVLFNEPTVRCTHITSPSA